MLSKISLHFLPNGKIMYPLSVTAVMLTQASVLQKHTRIKSNLRKKFAAQFEHLLCIRVQAGNLGQLCLIFADKMLDVVLSSVLDVCQLLANT